MNSEKISRGFYMSYINKDEIDRIFNIKTAQDYLLEIRANIVADNMRFFRVYRNKAMSFGEGWSFEKSFTTKPYKIFLKSLTEEDRLRCEKVTYGNIYSNDPNGYIMNTKYGPLITISDSLEYFFKFMNLALLQHEDDVPDYVCKNAIRIAIRVMLKTETLDFLMDPRGIVSEEISCNINVPIDYQYMTIVGHEFSHYLLGHLNNSSCHNKPILHAISESDTDSGYVRVFTQSQEQELEADLLSLSIPKLDDEEYKLLFNSTILWFCSLELYEVVVDLMFPPSSWDPSTHPTAMERVDNILMNAKKPKDFNYEDIESFRKVIDYYKDWLIDDVNTNLDMYETYGSVYLDEPITRWRGKELKDRVDYY